MTTTAELQTIPCLIGDRWVPAAGERLTVDNPATGEVIGELPCGDGATVDAAVQAARAVFPAWAATPLMKRVGVLFRYKQLLEDHFEEIAAIITREHGKTLPESKGDLRRGIEVVELCCGAGGYLHGESLPDIASELDALTWREPLGICAGITPFNFPAMVPLWMFPVALVCGNCFILKPSEKVPFTAQRLGELLLEAGLPAGVFNIVHGARPVVEGLCQHPGISAVSFVGSTAVAEAVYRMGTAAGKRVQAAGGAKNAMVVLPDADLDTTVRGVIGAAYGCSGQRCMAGSLVLGVGEAGDAIREQVSSAIDGLRTGNAGADNGIDIGPLIDARGKQRVIDGIETGISEGADLVRDGRQNMPEQGHFVGPTLFDRVAPDSRLAQEEWFGPLLALERPQDLDEAIAWINAHEYGNGAVIYTGSGGAARTFARHVQCGMVGVNVPVPAALAPYAFSGWNRSFFGDLHVQGREGFQFYTRQKLVLSRWDQNYQRTQGW